MQHTYTLSSFENRLVITLAAITILLCYSLFLYFNITQELTSDFGTIFNSVRQYWENRSIYHPVTAITFADDPKQLFPHARHGALLTLNLNSPALNLLILPFTFLKPAAAYALWQINAVICFGMSLWLIHKKLIKEIKLSVNLILFILTGFVFFPVYYNFIIGQVSLFLFFLLTLSWLLKDTSKGVYSAIILGTLFSIKLFFGIFLVYFIAARQWKALMVFILTSIVLNALAAFIFGFAVFKSYYHTLDTIRWYGSPTNFSLLGFLPRVFGGYFIGYYRHRTPAQPFFNLPQLTSVIYYISCFFIYAGFFWISQLRLKTHWKRELLFAYSPIAMLLISPLGWNYYFVFLIIPCLILFTHRPANTYISYILLMLSIFLTGLGYYTSEKVSISTTFFWDASGSYALIALLAATLYTAKKLSVIPQCAVQPVHYQKLYLTLAFFPSYLGLITYTGFLTLYFLRHP